MGTHNFSYQSAIHSALQLIHSGMPVLPVCSYNHHGVSKDHKDRCRKAGKCPLIRDWANQATTDKAKIEEWFSKWPSANVGAVLGERSGIIAIDVDGDFGRLELVKRSNGDLPPTWEFATPGNGYRYLYRAPEGHRFKKKSFASPDGNHEALEFLGDGQYTVMPGSVHPSGNPYIWAEGRSPADLDVALAPPWMLKLMSLAFEAEQLFDDQPIQATAEEQPDVPASTDSGNHSLAVLETASIESATAPTSMSTSMSTSSFTSASAEPADIASFPAMKQLSESCFRVREAFDRQAAGGCDESSWFYCLSLLIRLGKEVEALRFSRLSPKHNAWSEERIKSIMADAQAKRFGPPRCTTLGCDADQIRQCFGTLRQNDKGEATSSPAAHLLSNRSDLENVQALLKWTRYRIVNHKLAEPTFNNKGEENGHSSIANFVAIPVLDIHMDNGEETYRAFEIEGVHLRSGERLPPLRVKDSDFADLKWIIQWGLKPNLEPGYANKERMRHATQQLGVHAKNVRVYTHLGFRQINGKWRYLHAGGCVGGDDVQVELDNRLKNYALPAAVGDIKTALSQSLSLLEVAPLRVSLPMLALVFLAPLCELLRRLGIEPSFLFWLYGLTGSRKSTLAALFMCHFGTFTAKSPPASFKDTANSIERRSFDCKDTLIWIDDFHPTSNPQEARKMEQIAQAIIRSFGDRVGRGRMKTDASLRNDYKPRGLCVNTGEQQPDGHSSNARLASVELKPDDIDLHRLTEAQRNAHLLVEAMSGYVAWLGAKMDDPAFGQRLKQLFEKKRIEALPSQTHGRLAETAAWLFLGLECLLAFAAETGVVPEADKERRLTEGWQTLLSLADTQSEQVSEVRPSQRFLNVVSGLLSNGTLHTLPVNEPRSNEYDDMPRKGALVGWHDQQYFYFLPDPLYGEVSSFLSKQHEQIPLKPSALWHQLAESGELVPEIENDGLKTRPIKRKTINRARQKVLWIKREALEEPDPQSRSISKRRTPAVQKQNPGALDDVFADD